MLRGLGFALVIVALALPSSADDLSEWESSRLGDTLIVPLDSAPFPHESRTDGHTYQDTHYPADPHYVDSRVAIFVSRDFDAAGPTDLLFYFHGWGNHIAKSLDQFRLREMLVASGRNAVLVFPQGPKDAPDSSGGRLEEPQAFKAICDDVLDVLLKSGRIEHAELGRVALSGHSGAYRVIAKGLEHGGIDAHIDRVYLLDASYALLDTFADWIADEGNAESSRRLYSIFTDHLAPENVGIMTRLSERGIPYTLTTDTQAEANPELLLQYRATFLHTTTRDHDQAVFVLEGWLKADRAEPESNR
ncbi:MAG: hypothetical protein AAGF84_10385 [Planctomycetota bacterium]